MYKFLNYFVTHTDATTTYHASGMILYIYSDASYLCETKAPIRSGGYLYVKKNPSNATKPPTKFPQYNGPIHIKCSLFKMALASAKDAEFGSLFMNEKRCIHTCHVN